MAVAACKYTGAADYGFYHSREDADTKSLTEMAPSGLVVSSQRKSSR